MPKYNVTRRVPFSVEQVFEVTSDVASYRDFLPLTRRSVVRNRTILPDGRESFDAELSIVYKKLGIHETMASRVIVDRARNLVTSTSTEGPVQHLNAEWRIVAAGPEACDIHFSVDYALKSRSLQFIISGMFDLLVRKVMSAFEQRARELYGIRAAS